MDIKTSVFCSIFQCPKKSTFLETLNTLKRPSITMQIIMVSDGVRSAVFHSTPEEPQEQKKEPSNVGKFFLYISSFYSVSFSSGTYSIISPG